jgi:hypothetical protein
MHAHTIKSPLHKIKLQPQSLYVSVHYTFLITCLSIQHDTEKLESEISIGNKRLLFSSWVALEKPVNFLNLHILICKMILEYLCERTDVDNEDKVLPVCRVSTV